MFSRASTVIFPSTFTFPVALRGPEALLHAFMTLQRKIDEQHLTGATRPRHLQADMPSEFPIPEFGEHDLVPPNNPLVWHPPAAVRT